MFKRVEIILIMAVAMSLALAMPLLPGDALSPSDRSALIDLRENTKTWALTCPPGSGFEGSYSLYDGTCAQGDVTMFTGLACLAATLAEDWDTVGARCWDAARAQAVDGKWNRGPMWVGRDYPDGDFSRDQTRGVFAHLIARGYMGPDRAGAQDAANRWLAWIESSGGYLCPETDQNKCKIKTGVHNLFFNAYRHLGVLPPRRSSDLVKKFYDSQWHLTWGMNAELRTLWVETELRDKWYPVHIKASDVLIHRVMNMNPDYKVRNRKIARVLGSAAKYIQTRDQHNLLYQFLRYGNNEHLVDNVMSLAPTEKPVLTNALHDWSWQRGTHEKAWLKSDGHDWIYLINLMLAKDDGRLNW